MRTLIYLLIDA